MTTPISPDPRSPFFSRRELLKSLSSGFGYLAFAGLAASDSSAASGVQHEGPLADALERVVAPTGDQVDPMLAEHLIVCSAINAMDSSELGRIL